MPTIYAAGDTAVHADMGLIGEIYTPAIAILPIGDHYTMGPLQAAYAARLVAAPEIVPGHYGTFGLLTGTPAALREELARIGVSATVHEGQPGRGRAGLRVTFSIVACDVQAGQLGVAVASKFLAVGAVVPWLEAGVGAIATQALANTRYGPEGLAHLRDGASAREALDAVLAADARPRRPPGRASSTRAGAPRRTPGSAACRGRGAAPAPAMRRRATSSPGPDVVDAMAEAYEASSGDLADRLLLALAAGDAAGGDRRGRQSAAIAVVAPGGGYGGNDDRLVDLRVDDHTDPVPELRRLYGIHVLLTGTTPEEDKLPLDEARSPTRCATCSTRAGYPSEPGDGRPRRGAARVRRHREPRGALVARGAARPRRARAPAHAAPSR